jgi:hypothetical protein
MTKDEALDLALAALEQYTNVVTSVNDPNSWETVVDGGKPARDAITAIKQALPAPVQEPVAWRWKNNGEDKWLNEYVYLDRGGPDCPEECEPLYTTPPAAQPAPVPPAWFPAVENILNEYGLQAIDFVADFKAAMKDAEQSQRTWVDLTREEIVGCSTGGFLVDGMEFAKALLAKSKEKNT